MSFGIGFAGLTLSRPYLGSEANRCQSVNRGECQSVPSPVLEVQRILRSFRELIEDMLLVAQTLL